MHACTEVHNFQRFKRKIFSACALDCQLLVFDGHRAENALHKDCRCVIMQVFLRETQLKCP